MPRLDFIERLERRCARSGVDLPAKTQEILARYVELLAKWNAKINLTSLPLTPPSDEALDRLFVEPLAAVSYLPIESASWFDLGSGGGSPALPLRIARADGMLTMIEAKARKAAFLREAVRILELPQAFVLHSRFEEVAAARAGEGQLVTVRAVRTDDAFVGAAASLLGFEGRLLVFSSSPAGARFPGFDQLETVPLVKGHASFLSIYRRVVPRGTTKQPQQPRSRS